MIQLNLDNIEMRKIYANTMLDMMNINSQIIALEADLMSSMSMDAVMKQKPNQVINCGIMEANIVGIAAGLSLTGKIPFFHTFAPFASRRCFDQIFMSGDYQKNNIKIIASDPGITATHNGGTHMCFEDMGLIRGLAHAVVMEMTDATMFENILRQVVKLDGLHWIRTTRKQAVKIYKADEQFEIGKAKVLREGKDVTIIANGIMVAEALQAANQLASDGVEATVIDMFTLKPIDKDAIVKYAKLTGKVVTCENHSVRNGLGSAVAEVLAEFCPTEMRFIGIKDAYGQVGTIDYLKSHYRLTANDIIEQVKSFNH